MRRVCLWVVAGLMLAMVAGLAVLAVGFHNATRPPVVVQRTLPLAGLKQPVRVALVSDIHYGWPDMRTRRLNSIVTLVNAQKPDLILLAGDYMGGKWLDWPRSWLEEALPPLAALRAPLGVYAVSGNHDQPGWTATVLRRQIAPTLIDRQLRDVGPLVVAGFASASFGNNGAALVRRLPADKPALLLMHEPEQMLTIPGPVRPGIVALAGHTHGGQVVLPLLGSLGRLHAGSMPCRRGLCRLHGWPVFVTSGVGTSMLPIRFGVPPEIVVLTLVPGQPDAYSAGRKSGTDK